MFRIDTMTECRARRLGATERKKRQTKCKLGESKKQFKAHFSNGRYSVNESKEDFSLDAFTCARANLQLGKNSKSLNEVQEL